MRHAPGSVARVWLALAFLSAGCLPCVAVEVTHDYGPIEWSFQGKPVPETLWSPWLPPAQVGLRFKLGFLISDGTITIKSPVRLTFRYDPEGARSGQDFTFAVKAEPVGADHNTFQSAFGISFPNKIQLGFAGVPGCPIELPWFDLPYDFWELIAEIPEVGEPVASAVSNIGVNTGTEDALPLGQTAAYHNERDLIEVELTDAKVEDLAPDVLGKIPEGVRKNALRLIKLANYCSDEEALEKLEEYTENALNVIYEAPTLTLKGDPYFKLEGVRLRVNVRVQIPGGKGSGAYTLYFDRMNQTQGVTFRDITPFISPGDKLVISVEDVAYEFRLIQGLTASVQVSVVPFALDTVEKVVTYTTAVRDTTNDPFKIEVPLRPSDAVVQSLRSHPGYTSVSVNWASPSVPLKGTVKAYEGTTVVATVIENAFKTAHNVIVPNLQQGRTYRFTVECVNQAGQVIPGGETTATTVPGAMKERIETAQANALRLTAPAAVAGPDFVDFTWTTNQPASTEVMFSPSPDLSLNYIMAVKKVGDVVTQGWVTREGPREFATQHAIRLAGLEPNTKYYYNLRSWTFVDNDETKNPQDAVGFVGTVTTQPGHPPPTLKVRVRCPAQGNQPVTDMPVVLTKNTDPDFRVAVSSGPAGVSQEVVLDRGTTYTLEALGNASYLNGTAQVTVPAQAQGPLPEAVIDVGRVPARRAFVLSGPNQGIAGALVTGKNAQGAPISVQTAANGSWAVESGLSPGSHTFTVAKDGYRTATVDILVTPGGRFIGLPVTLVPRTFALQVLVRNAANRPVKSASVVVRDGDSTVATLTTDAQGKAAKTGTLGDDQAHTWTLDVAPPATTTENILPTQDFVTITSGETRSATVLCPADRKPPAFSQVRISQVGARALQVSFRADDPKGMCCVQYQGPDGRLATTPWKAGMGTAASGFADHTVTVQSGTLKAGVYRLKVKGKDKWNNQGEGDIHEFTLFGEAQWNLKAEQAPGTVTFTWNQYPYPEGFGKYVLTVAGQPAIEIADINTTRHVLANYTATAARQATLTARAAGATTDLALPATVQLQPGGAPAQGQAAVTGGAQPAQGQATTGTAAPEKTTLKLLGKPTTARVNREIALTVDVKTVRLKKVPAACTVDWGDGRQEAGEAGVPLKHTYTAAGRVTVSATATPRDLAAYAPPTVGSGAITVVADPPRATFTKTTLPAGAGHKFSVKVQAGSFPIAQWTLAFGDGATETGTAAVTQSFTHQYAPGTHKAELTVTDAAGTVVRKTLTTTVLPKP